MKAKSYFDSKEFERLDSLLDELNSLDKDTASLALLGAHYFIQKRIQVLTSSVSVLPQKQRLTKTTVDNLVGEKIRLCRFAETLSSRFGSDSILTYLHAIIVQAFSPGVESSFVADLLARSIRLCPWNWAAWLELGQLSPQIVAEAEPSLSEFELFRFYKLEQMRAQKQFPELLRDIKRLGIKQWLYVDELEGVCHHELRDFASAVVCFDRITQRDKYHIGGMDTLSNCLFVLERSAELSELAHHWLETSPNAPETNVIVGNYFSLRSEHEKAAVHFKRATLLSPNDVNAWLLLGHELIELRNPSAALAAYQQAARCPGSSRDVRPWYAMGQLFELINQFAFAVYYHNRAVQVDPNDVRIWKALSNCYMKLNRVDESNHCSAKINAVQAR